jgi:hypothetical protein
LNIAVPKRIAPILVLILLSLPTTAFAQETYTGRSVLEVLNELRQDGAPLVYSSNLVSPELEVKREPEAGPAIEIARQILAPYGLTLQFKEGVYLVVRAPPDDAGSASPADSRTSGADALKPDHGSPELEKVTVSASRYVLQSVSSFFVDQRAIQALPDLGDDPLRAAHRLPGAAANGLSSKTYFRGGLHDETAIYLNGLQLLDPFHIRDYHSIFSSIDARAISGVEAYTGGFPAQYGDHMSGVLSLDSQLPETPRHTELGLSVYNTSILHSGYSEGGEWDWLISARDSNLDLVLDPSLGSPDYFDVFAQLGYQFNDRTYVSFNALYAKDSVVVITENDPTELERSDSHTDNQHFWVRMENDWLPELTSSTVLSRSYFDNLRVAQANDPEQMIARVRDQREVEVWALSQDWQWTGWSGHDLRWGFWYGDESARYNYSGIAVYEGLLAQLPYLEDPRVYEVETNPDGYGLSLYLSDRWRWSDATWLQYGVRWDRQTWTVPQYSNQFSPRISFLHNLNATTDFRFGWGRYSQSQAIQHLQVEDGVDQYFAPQRSDHYIVGMRKLFDGGYRLRAEAYYKQYEDLKPRYENLFNPLALIPEMAPDRVRLAPTSAEAVGLEFSLEFRGEGDLDWWVTYVLSKTTDRINGRDQPRSWDQLHAFQAGISWRPGRWEVGAAIEVHTGWPITPLYTFYDPLEDELIPVPGERNSEKYATFLVLDIRVSREFEVKKGRLSAFIEVSNATNRKNPCCTDFDVDDMVAPPVLDRTLDYWVPIIPAVGILWEF